MSDIAVRVENVSKRYRIGMKNEMHDSFVGAMVDFVKGPLTNLKRLRKLSSFDQHSDDCDDIIWALRDVSFEVKRGEVVGIIGNNGSGKSTLLKIISRVTEPTKGRGETNGRVGSLLEVGTGFHPELTGRENIYLNGAVLGMKKMEIAHKFDAIVDFSGVEKFIDTPVKRYSSGMYVRLAFAVAAHLEPEILLVDEVLAVGDAAFQKKCLGKMGDVAKDGRTVLFVSHNMGAISRLCDRSLLLHRGGLVKDGPSIEAVSEYLEANTKIKQTFSQLADDSLPFSLMDAEVFSEGKKGNNSFPRHKAITVRMRYKVARKMSSVHVYSNIITADGTVVLGTGDADVDQSKFGPRKPGVYVCQYQIPGNMLNEGDYTVSISIGVPYQRNFQENHGILAFTVMDIEPVEKFVHRRRAGVVWLNIPWDYLNGNPFS